MVRGASVSGADDFVIIMRLAILCMAMSTINRSISYLKVNLIVVILYIIYAGSRAPCVYRQHVIVPTCDQSIYLTVWHVVDNLRVKCPFCYKQNDYKQSTQHAIMG